MRERRHFNFLANRAKRADEMYNYKIFSNSKATNFSYFYFDY